jgi:hypothetical protein
MSKTGNLVGGFNGQWKDMKRMGPSPFVGYGKKQRIDDIA